MARDGIREVETLGRVFSALAHPSRRQVLIFLRARGDRVKAGDIASRFSCSWPTTTRHLNQLEAAGLVSVEKNGRERYYRLQKEHLLDVVDAWLDHLRDG